MAIESKKLNISNETACAVFIFALASVFILADFAIGFILPLYLLAGLAGLAISFLYPRSGVYAIVFLTMVFERFFTLQPLLWGDVEYKIYPIDFILIGVILGTLAFILAKLREREFQFIKTDWLLIGFMLVTSIYFFASLTDSASQIGLAFSSLKNYIFYPLLYFIGAMLFNKKEDFLRLLKFALAGALVILFFIFYGLFSGSGLWAEYTPLSTEGVRTLAFTHAFYLSMALSVLFIWIVSRKAHKNNAILVLIAVWSVGILGSMMRHLWIAMLAVFAAMYLVFNKDLRKGFERIFVKFIPFILIGSLLIFYVLAMSPYSKLSRSAAETGQIISTRAASLFDTGDESISWRSEIWKRSLEEYSKSPILGIGLGKQISIEIGKDYHDFVKARDIHNSWLGILVQFGISSVLFFGFVLNIGWKLFKKAFKDDFWSFARLSVLAVFILHLVAFSFQPYLEANLLGLFFWLNLGLARTLYSLKED